MKKFLLGLFLISALPVNAAIFENGDFEVSGGASWTDASGSGTVNFSGGQAILETGDGIDGFSAEILQGSGLTNDGFLDFANPFTLAVDAQWLIFDAMFERSVDGSEDGTGSDDALFVSLYDFDDLTGDSDVPFEPLLVLDNLGVDALSMYALNLSILTGNSLSSLQGREVVLDFILSDENDGFNSKVTLDNIQFVASLPTGNVPEPSVLVLLIAGLPLVGRFLKKSQS